MLHNHMRKVIHNSRTCEHTNLLHFHLHQQNIHNTADVINWRQVAYGVADNAE